jgi:LppX_LprAFG lipoprotein
MLSSCLVRRHGAGGSEGFSPFSIGGNMPIPLVFLLLFSNLLGFGAASAASPAASAQDADHLLSHSVETTLANRSFHFSVHNEQGQTTIFPGVRLNGVEGDVQPPDRFQAKLRAKPLLGTVTIKVVGIGDRFWLANPLLGGDRYQEQHVDPGILALARPDSFVKLIPSLVSDLAIGESETIDDVQTTTLHGTLDLTRLKEVAPDVPTSAINTDKTLPFTAWIDENNLIRRIRIEGELLTYDNDEVVRVLDFSAFDEPIEIETPT